MLPHQQHVDGCAQGVLAGGCTSSQVEQHAAIQQQVAPGVAGQGIEHDVALSGLAKQGSTKECHASIQQQAAA